MFSHVFLRSKSRCTRLDLKLVKFKGFKQNKIHHPHPNFRTIFSGEEERETTKPGTFRARVRHSAMATPSPISVFVVISFLLFAKVAATLSNLQFNRRSGEFKILQVADMHYGNGASTPCLDVLPIQERGCSDFNSTRFLSRLIRAENPDLIVFSGRNPNKTLTANSLKQT